MSRDKLIQGMVVLVILVGLLVVIVKRFPNDTQKVHQFQQQFVVINNPVTTNITEFTQSYKMAQSTHTLRTLYITAMQLNLIAKGAMEKSTGSLNVPTMKNKAAQADLQKAHDLYMQYLKSLIALTQNVINIAQRTGFVAQMPNLTLPTTQDVTANISAAEKALQKS